jgi:hypothetical protein
MENNKEKRCIFGYNFEATPKQLNEIYYLLCEEKYTSKRFQKYLYVWIMGDNTGVYWFPKEKYSSYKGNNYIVALMHYAGKKYAHKSKFSID